MRADEIGVAIHNARSAFLAWSENSAKTKCKMKRNALTRKKRFAEQIKFLSWATALSKFETLFLLLNLLEIQAFLIEFYLINSAFCWKFRQMLEFFVDCYAVFYKNCSQWQRGGRCHWRPTPNPLRKGGGLRTACVVKCHDLLLQVLQ